VGGKILLANGDLQEAGSIVWSDGSVQGYGRLDQPDLPQYEFRRPTDYCSAAFLFTCRRLFKQLGGFDPIYTGCYEDTDYCMKVWEAGLRLIYDPRSVIRHYNSASLGGNELADRRMAPNQDKFVARWQRNLSMHCPQSVEHLMRARIASQSKGIRILYLDDLVPHKSLGAGFPRSNDILRHLVKQGHHVTFATMRRPLDSLTIEYGDIAREIELIDGTRYSERLFRECVPSVDLIWVSRPHNLASFLEMVMEFGGFSAKLVFDAEAIYSDRDRLRANLRNILVPSRILDARLKRELALAQAADTVIVVSPRDQAVMEREGISNIHVLGFCLTANPTSAPFRDRHSFLFIGAVHGSENPNADSVRYFCNEIWPEVRRRTGAELIIAGFGTDQYLTDIECEGLRIIGPVDDLTSVYNTARVFVAPTRYAAGIPFKVHEAAASGVPSVVSQLIGEQLGWEDGKDVLVGRDGAAFSNLCCELYANECLWHKLRANVLSRVRAELHPVAYAEKISSILAGARKSDTQPATAADSARSS
jgi:glycosyltransferase involved in cell wall biosynthesis